MSLTTSPTSEAAVEISSGAEFRVLSPAHTGLCDIRGVEFDLVDATARASMAATTWVCGCTGIQPRSGCDEQLDYSKTHIILDDSFTTGHGHGTSVIILPHGSLCLSILFSGSRRIAILDETPVSCWSDDTQLLRACVAPNLVCKHPLKTIGEHSIRSIIPTYLMSVSLTVRGWRQHIWRWPCSCTSLTISRVYVVFG
jgi:hypothetical protein